MSALLGALLLLTASPSFAGQKPLKVFLLVGQSNMQGHARVSTFDHIGMDPKRAPLLRKMRDKEGHARVLDDVWISYLSTGGVKQGKLTAGFGAAEDKIGPEFTFGIRLQELFDEPILIIKTAWGGKSLHTDFRPPSAGPYAFSVSQLEGLRKRGKDVAQVKAEKLKATGHYYRLMLEHVKKVLADIGSVYPGYDPKSGYELAGFVWFQGWNDMVDGGVYPHRGKAGGYDAYSETLAHFIRDVRRDLKTPQLPFVIGVMGVGGPIDQYPPEKRRYAGIHGGFRDAMAAPADLPLFQGNVAAVRTESYWDMELARLTARENKVKQAARARQKKEKLDRKQASQLQETLLAAEFSDYELKVLRAGVSNFEFHYLGCAKIMARIGVGFADAVVELGAD